MNRWLVLNALAFLLTWVKSFWIDDYEHTCNSCDEKEFQFILRKPPGAFDEEYVQRWSFEQNGWIKVNVVSSRAGIGELGYIAWGVSPGGKMSGGRSIVGFASGHISVMDLTRTSMIRYPESSDKFLSHHSIRRTSAGFLELQFQVNLSLLWPINFDTTDQYIIWAYGSENGGYHKAAGSFKIELLSCTMVEFEDDYDF